MNVKTEVIAYLEAHKPIPGANEEEKFRCSYLDVGIIDSMGIIKMVMNFEEKFGIQFDADDLQSFEFQTVGGLIGLIEKRLQK